MTGGSICHFLLKLYFYLTTSPTQGVLKNYTQNYQDSNLTVLFLRKNKIKQRIYNQELINQNNISIRKDEER